MTSKSSADCEERKELKIKGREVDGCRYCTAGLNPVQHHFCCIAEPQLATTALTKWDWTSVKLNSVQLLGDHQK